MLRRCQLTHPVEASSAETLDAPLHDAAKRGNIAFLQECIANNVSVNGLDKVPLHVLELLLCGET